jgi:hypothetical protein
MRGLLLAFPRVYQNTCSDSQGKPIYPHSGGVIEGVSLLNCRKLFWRRERDSNPRAPFGANGFQDRRFQPLTHPSSSGVTFQLTRSVLVRWLPGPSVLAHCIKGASLPHERRMLRAISGQRPPIGQRRLTIDDFRDDFRTNISGILELKLGEGAGLLRGRFTPWGFELDSADAVEMVRTFGNN